MLVGRVIDDQLGDHAQAATPGVLHEAAEISRRPEGRIDVAVIGDVVAVVAAGARIERQQPERGDAEVAQVVETLGQTGEVADAIAIRILERLDVQLVYDGILEPEVVVKPLCGFGVDGRDDIHVSL
jgi:hypothetical protein